MAILPHTFRIRRCGGNKSAWLLCALRDDGTESDSYGSYVTAPTLDMLLARADHLTPKPGDTVEFQVEQPGWGSVVEIAALRERVDRIERALDRAASAVPLLARMG